MSTSQARGVFKLRTVATVLPAPSAQWVPAFPMGKLSRWQPWAQRVLGEGTPLAGPVAALFSLERRGNTVVRQERGLSVQRERQTAPGLELPLPHQVPDRSPSGTEPRPAAAVKLSLNPALDVGRLPLGLAPPQALLPLCPRAGLPGWGPG